MSLFRPEAIDAQRRRLHGNVVIHQPIVLRIATALFALATVSGAIFLSTASFERREQVSGWLAPEFGMSNVYASPGAVVRRVVVKPGQRVRKGDVIAFVSTEVFDAKGSLPQEELRQTALQISEVRKQVGASRDRERIEASRLQQQLKASTGILGTLAAQRQLVEEELLLSRRQFNSIAPIVERGFISQFDADKRLQAVLAMERSLNEIDRQISQAEADASNLRSQLADSNVRQALEESQLRGSEASLNTSLAALGAAATSTIRAPVSGVIATVNVRPGETLSNQIPVAAVAPPGPLIAELLVPTRSAGFMKEGQAVRVFVDAFPFQRFGTLNGRISQVARSAMPPEAYPQAAGNKEPVYRVAVPLSTQGFSAYGKLRPLTAGMTVTGQIVTDRRTIAQWLFEPILAIRKAI